MSMTIALSKHVNEENPAHIEFAALLENSFKKDPKAGEIVAGEILKIDKDNLVVDIGGKCEGLVPLREIPNAQNEAELNEIYSVGQVVELFVLRNFDDEAPYMLSMRRVSQRKDWDILEEIRENNGLVDVKVLSLSRGGLLVLALGLKGFIPGSQLRVAKPIPELMGEMLPAKVLEVDRTRNKLILSQRAAAMEVQAEQRQNTLSQLSMGQFVEGQVLKITDFGAFIDVNGIDGLLPLSEISWRRIQHPSDELNLGDMVKVTVLSVDMERQRISLSRKRLSKDPWNTITERLQEGQTIEGRISKCLGTGYLIEVEDGIEGFCSFNHHANRDDVVIGNKASFKVVSVLANERRITLDPA